VYLCVTSVYFCIILGVLVVICVCVIYGSSFFLVIFLLFLTISFYFLDYMYYDYNVKNKKQINKNK